VTVRKLVRTFKAIFFDLDGTLAGIRGPLYIARATPSMRAWSESAAHPRRYWAALARDDLCPSVHDHLRSRYLPLALA
jgi:FMN phosphatase YigB (HAD superfamily)